MDEIVSKIRLLVERLGQTYSERLGIDLKSKDPHELFKWFLASILFGTRINETIAMNTYKQFEKDGLLSPNRIQDAGWDRLVRSLDNGGYVRYDFKTADMLLDVAKKLREEYDGDLVRLYEKAGDSKDLERRLKGFKGVGDVTVEIFLRELRDVWEKANPLPGKLAMLSAKNLGFTALEDKRVQILNDLRRTWSRGKIPGKEFVHLETALVRLGKDFCRKGKCDRCFIRGHCTVK